MYTTHNFAKTLSLLTKIHTTLGTQLSERAKAALVLMEEGQCDWTEIEDLEDLGLSIKLLDPKEELDAELFIQLGDTGTHLELIFTDYVDFEYLSVDEIAWCVVNPDGSRGYHAHYGPDGNSTSVMTLQDYLIEMIPDGEDLTAVGFLRKLAEACDTPDVERHLTYLARSLEFAFPTN